MYSILWFKYQSTENYFKKLFRRKKNYKYMEKTNLCDKKAEEPEIKLPTSAGSLKKQESSRKTSISALLTMPKPLTVDHNKLENSSRDGNTRPADLPLEKPVCRSGSNS